MPSLRIHLQHGFEGDEVIVRINGEERLYRESVRTKRVLGLAEHTQLDVGEGPFSIEVSVPNRGLQKTVEVEPGDELHVGVSIAKDGLRVIARNKRFGYG